LYAPDAVLYLESFEKANPDLSYASTLIAPVLAAFSSISLSATTGTTFKL
jgi:hypothetical protein